MDSERESHMESIDAADALRDLEDLAETLREWESIMVALGKELDDEGESIPSHIWDFGETARKRLNTDVTILRRTLSMWESTLREGKSHNIYQ